MQADSSSWILGFDVGGTKTAVVAGTVNGRVLERASWPSNAAGGFESMWAAMVSSAEQLILTRGRPVAIGASIGGPLDTERGIVHSPTNLPGWDAYPLKDRLAAHFSVPAYVETDARAGALAEWMFGAATGAHDLIYMPFGTGLGDGLILADRRSRGPTYAAREAGQWRLSRPGPTA